MPTLFYPFSEYYWIYLLFSLFIIGVLLLDLGVFHKKAHVMTWKESLTWSIFWVGLAFLFNYGLYCYSLHSFSNNESFLNLPGFSPDAEAKRLSLEFLTGFLLEKALSIDNIFVFIVIFNLLNIPLKFQHRVLFYGILGAFLFRAIFIALGSLLMKNKILIILFGIFLIGLGLKCLFVKNKKIPLKDNWIFKVVSYFCKIKKEVRSGAFFVREKKVLYITPLFLALVMIECTDVVFAFDSVPAIFAITKEPLIVFTSNIFALLGLRAIYFLLEPIVERFRYLKYGLGIILIFIGLKMLVLNDYFGGHFPVAWSLSFIIGVVSICICLTWILPSKKKAPLSL